MALFPFEESWKEIYSNHFPCFQWYKIDRLSDSALMRINVSLVLPADMPNGEYTLKLSLIEQSPDTSPLTKRERSV